MLKLIGSFFLLAGVFGYGVCLVSDFNKNLIALKEIEELITVLSGYISYERATLTEAIRNCSRRMNGTGKLFLEKILEKLDEKEGASIADVWKEESVLWEEELQEEEVERLGTLFEQSGYLERKMQLHILENYRNELKEKIEKLEEKKEGKVRIYYASGIMGGLFFCILLW